MPTGIPARHVEALDISVMHLIMVPVSILVFSTLMQGDTISATSLIRTLMHAAEAIAEAELGFGRGWITGRI